MHKLLFLLPALASELSQVQPALLGDALTVPGSVALNGQCVRNTDCASNFCSFANSNICQAKLPNGSSCLVNDACESDRCSPQNGMVCTDRLPDNTKCALNQDCQSNFCNWQNGQRCMTKLEVGKQCIFDTDCKAGWCSALKLMTCSEPLEDGQICSSSVNCKSGWCSTAAGSTCAQKQAAGENCVFNVQCASHYCHFSWHGMQCATHEEAKRRQLGGNTSFMEHGHNHARRHHGQPNPEHHDLHLGHSRPGPRNTPDRPTYKGYGNQDTDERRERRDRHNSTQQSERNCFLLIFCNRRLTRRKLPNTLVMEGGHKAQRAHHGKAHPEHHDLHLGHSRTGLRSGRPQQNNQNNRGRNNNRTGNNQRNRGGGKLCLFGICLP